MPAVTTAYVRNIIRRGFSEMVDPPPSPEERAAIWTHFDDCCAYCGCPLRRTEKEGHIDHLVPASQGGANAVGNRVLSCATCNEKEKLDRPWEVFLRNKAQTDADFVSRRQRILDWQRKNPAVDDPRRQDLIAFARLQAAEVVSVFDRAAAKVQSMAETGAC